MQCLYMMHRAVHRVKGMCCRKLLARLCIAREEIAEVAAEQKTKGDYSGSDEEIYETKMTFHNQGMPQASLAFLKELLTMADKTKRYIAHTAFPELTKPTICTHFLASAAFARCINRLLPAHALVPGPIGTGHQV